MLEEVDVGRFQARCACIRSSPVFDGEREAAEASLRRLEWKQTASDAWRCPVCWGRCRTEPPRAPR